MKREKPPVIGERVKVRLADRSLVVGRLEAFDQSNHATVKLDDGSTIHPSRTRVRRAK